MFFNFKKIITATLVIAIVAPSAFLAWPVPVRAAVPVDQKAQVLSFNTKESVIGWDMLAWGVAKFALVALSQLTIDWVRNGNQSFSESFYGGAQAWVKNFEVYLRDAADHAAGIFIGELLGSEVQDLLCSPFRINLNHYFSIRAGFPPFPHAKCTLTKIISNIENFQVDFSQGGNEAFLEMFLNPANHPIGALTIEEARKETMALRRMMDAESEIKSGQGFLGIKKCVNELEDPLSGQKFCEKYEIKTPGKVAQDQLAEALKSPLKGFQHADEISEIIAQFVVALASALIQNGLSG